MCGRYAITLPPEAVRAFFRYVEQPNFPPRYNIAPTQPVPIVRLERTPTGERARHFALVRWGFIPGWVKDPRDHPLVINARSESITDKPSFRAAMMRRRCLFIADAFYEWRRVPGTKGRAASTPYMIRRTDGQPMGLAGLWEPWLGADGSEVDTACIVTTLANGPLAAIHERMPVVLAPEHFDRWLDVDAVDAPGAAALLRPAPDETLAITEIGRAVNKVDNDGPHVQEPVAQAPPAPRSRAPDLFD